MDTQPKDKKSRVYLLILIGILLALNIGILAKMMSGKKENEELTAQNVALSNDKKALEADLAQSEADLNAMRAENDSLSSELQAKDQDLEAKIKQIKSLLSNNKLTTKQFNQAKADIQALKDEITAYKNQIAELTQRNTELMSENAGLSQSLSSEQTRSAEKDKVIATKDKVIAIAKRLHANSVSAVGVRERKMFGKKEVATDKAAKTEEVKVVFSIDKNAVSDAGDKDIFVKLIAPDGSPVTTKVQTTKVDGTETLYTQKIIIDYQNEKTAPYSVYCTKQNGFQKGEYTIELFTEGYKIGSTKLLLK